MKVCIVKIIGTTYSWFVWHHNIWYISHTILYEDNAARVAQMSNRNVKWNLKKHITTKLFYPHKFQKNDEIIVEKVLSIDNLVNLFTKFFPTSTFEKNMFMILKCVGLENYYLRGERQVQNNFEDLVLKINGCTLFLWLSSHMVFLVKVFLVKVF